MTAIRDSFIGDRLLLFCSMLLRLYRESATGRACSALGRRLHKGAAQSVILQICARKGVLARKWKDSAAYRITDRAANFLLPFFHWLRRFPRVRESAVVGFCIGAGKRAYLLLGLLYLIMMVAPHAYWNNVYGFVGVLIIALLFFLSRMPGREHGLDVERFGVYFVLYALTLVSGLVFSYRISLSLRFFLFYLTCLLTILLLLSAVETVAQLKRLLAIVLGGTTVSALYGCYQSIVGVAINYAQVDYSLELNANIPGRIYSFFDNPNNFAEILVMLLPLYLAFLFISKGWLKKFLVFAALIPALVAMLKTYSRSGWIGLAIAALIFFAFLNWRLVPLFIVGGIVAFPLMPQTMIDRVLTIGNKQDSSTMYRFQIYQTLIPMFKDYWKSGVGLGSDVVKEMIMKYPTELYNGAYPIHSHNTYFQVWIEMGILGILSFLGGLLFQIKEGVRRIVSPRISRDLKCIIGAGVAGICGMAVMSAVEYTWFYPRVMFFFWFLLGIVMTGVRLAGKKTQS